MRTAGTNEPATTAPPVGGGIGLLVPYAQCVSTIVQEQGSYIRFVTRRYDECYFYRHMAPLVVYNEEGKVENSGEEEAQEAGNMNKGWESKLSRLGCNMEGASRTMWSGSVKTGATTGATATNSPATNGSPGTFSAGRGLMSGWTMLLWRCIVSLGGTWIHVGLF